MWTRDVRWRELSSALLACRAPRHDDLDVRLLAAHQLGRNGLVPSDAHRVVIANGLPTSARAGGGANGAVGDVGAVVVTNEILQDIPPRHPAWVPNV